ncbi:hypothetical protein C0992_003485 [Termitomyces sp. T32_za158]|nr:hypothetical protein C0992_003485 [Termitomyces sp. T32_za158]
MVAPGAGPSECVAMEDASPDTVDRALRQPRGPPTREWHQANSPLWKARCVAREQGWDLTWVWAQMGEKTKVHLGEPPQAGPRVLPSAPVVPVGPRVNNARFEEVQAEGARWRLEAEELRRERTRGYALAQEQEEELGRGDEVERLQVQLVRAAGLGEAAGPTVITAAEIDVLAQGLQEAHKLEGRRREWLLREVAGGRDNALTWAWEHPLLLDGLSSGVSYVVEEAALAALPPELAQGVARLERLMAVHRHRNVLDPRSWLEAFVDGLQDLPSEEEIVEIIQEAMAVKFGLGGNGARGPGVRAQGLAGGVRGPVGGAQGPGGTAA